eukprot:COSAG03_NODE_14448_length_464_cov_0.539726_1_plen_56_part_10
MLAWTATSVALDEIPDVITPSATYTGPRVTQNKRRNAHIRLGWLHRSMSPTATRVH